MGKRKRTVSVSTTGKRRWHYVYLARARDGSLYCGYALDPHARVSTHNSGRGARSLRGKLPVQLGYVRRFADRGDALRYEIALKRASHAAKSGLCERWLRRRRQTKR